MDLAFRNVVVSVQRQWKYLHYRSGAATTAPARLHSDRRHKFRRAAYDSGWQLYHQQCLRPGPSRRQLTEASSDPYALFAGMLAGGNAMRKQAKNITAPQTWQAIVGRRRFVRRIL